MSRVEDGARQIGQGHRELGEGIREEIRKGILKIIPPVIAEAYGYHQGDAAKGSEPPSTPDTIKNWSQEKSPAGALSLVALAAERPELLEQIPQAASGLLGNAPAGEMKGSGSSNVLKSVAKETGENLDSLYNVTSLTITPNNETNSDRSSLRINSGHAKIPLNQVLPNLALDFGNGQNYADFETSGDGTPGVHLKNMHNVKVEGVYEDKNHKTHRMPENISELIIKDKKLTITDSSGRTITLKKDGNKTVEDV